MKHNEVAVTWRRSSYCGNGQCVEVAGLGESFAVRDSKDPNSPVLAFGAAQWSAFISEVSRTGMRSS
jgi:hypothetical protein